jgi:hypothetical protein
MPVFVFSDALTADRHLSTNKTVALWRKRFHIQNTRFFAIGENQLMGGGGCRFLGVKRIFISV